MLYANLVLVLPCWLLGCWINSNFGPTHLFLQLVLSMSLSVGSVLAVAIYVFGTILCILCTVTVYVSGCHWGLSCPTLLACSLVLFSWLHSWFALLIHSLGPVCAVTSCASEFPYKSSLCNCNLLVLSLILLFYLLFGITIEGKNIKIKSREKKNLKVF